MVWLNKYIKPLVAWNLMIVASFIAITIVTYSTSISLIFVFKIHLAAMVLITSFATILIWLFLEEGK